MTCSASGGDAARAAELLQGARRVLIGAGAGLSAAAGLSYGGERFVRNFAPFIEKYGMTDMYAAGFYPFPSEEARWGYWARVRPGARQLRHHHERGRPVREGGLPARAPVRHAR